MAFLFQPAIQPAVDVNGDRISGASWRFDLTGTTTLTPVYANEARSVSLTNPVEADATGKFPQIFLNSAIRYRARLYDASDILLAEVDPYDVQLASTAVTLAMLAANGGAALIGTSSGEDLQEVLDGLTGSGFYTPEQFGAVGDGVTNDTDAFGLLAATVNANGGGVIEFGMGKIYIVGKQDSIHANFVAGSGYGFQPRDLLAFEGCTKGIVIRGNGAKMKCAPGLYYGVFNEDGTDAVSGAVGAPYVAMISARDCTGSIVIENIELDGQREMLNLGGPYGDTGYQLPALGLDFHDNLGSIYLNNIYAHHHGLDGIQVDGVNANETSRFELCRADNCRFDFNGRQGLSFVGGKGWTFNNCSFSHTGRVSATGTANSLPVSQPAAGVDLEAEGSKKVRDVVFNECEMVNCAGAAIVSDGTDVDRVVLNTCKMVGTTTYAGWLASRGFKLKNCLVVGTVVFSYNGSIGTDSPTEAATYEECRFTTDTAFSPTGTVFFENTFVGNVGLYNRFVRCKIEHTRVGLSGGFGNLNETSIEDCEFVAKAGTIDLYGRFRGRNEMIEDGGTFTALPVGLFNATVAGVLRTTGGHSESSWYFTAGGVRTRQNATLDECENIFGNTARGDTAVTLTPGVDTMIQTWSAANITTARAVTLAAANKGSRFKIIRTVAGAGALNIGTGPLKALTAANQWAEVEHNGSSWVLVAYGTL